MQNHNYNFTFFIFIILVFIVFLYGCVGNIDSVETPEPKTEDVEKTVTDIEYIGGKYNLSLEITEIRAGNRTGTMKMISYEKDGQTIKPDQMLPDNMKPGLEWLKTNTPEDAIIMSWWDYGHAIRAYSAREPVVDSPSKKSLVTTVAKYAGKSPDEIDCPDCAPHELLQDIASLFLAKNNDYAVELMNKYSATYLYVHRDDRIKADAFFIILDKEQDSISETVLDKALEGDLEIGFNLVYEDNIAKIYELA